MTAITIPHAAVTARDPRSIVIVMQTIEVGGMEAYCIDLACEYARRGISVTAVIPELPVFEVVRRKLEAGGVHVVRRDTNERHGRARQLLAWFPLGMQLRRLRPDVVHVNVAGGTGGIGVVAAARVFTGATVALTEHNVPPEGLSLRQRLTHLVIDRTTHVTLAVSRYNATLRRSRSSVRERTFASVLNGVPLPSDPPKVRAEARDRIRTELGIPGDEPVIGCVVRLVDGKGLGDLVRAFVRLRETHACRLLLVGDGPLAGELEQLATELGVSDTVHFAGRQDDPFPYMAAMDIFALAVPAGSMSIALLEAMARGVAPVITFCGPEEAVIDGETGLAAPPSDPEGLARVLDRLLADGDLRRRLGAAAAEHVRRHFSMTRVANDVLEAYASARAGRVPARLRADAPPNPRPGGD